MELKEKLTALRKEKGLSQLELAEALVVSRQAISKWEVGDTVPSTTNLQRLAKLYGVPLEYLANDDLDELLAGNTEEAPEQGADEAEVPTGTSREKFWKRLAIAALILCGILAAALFYILDSAPDYGDGIMISVGLDDVTTLPLRCVGQSVAPFTEIKSEQVQGDPHTVLAETTYVSTSEFERSLSASPAWGKYISVTVTNNGEEPLLFQLGREYEGAGKDMLSTHIPAGETVTRAFEIANTNSRFPPTLDMRLSYYGALPQEINVVVSATQFQ